MLVLCPGICCAASLSTRISRLFYSWRTACPHHYPTTTARCAASKDKHSARQALLISRLWTIAQLCQAAVELEFLDGKVWNIPKTEPFTPSLPSSLPQAHRERGLQRFGTSSYFSYSIVQELPGACLGRSEAYFANAVRLTLTNLIMRFCDDFVVAFNVCNQSDYDKYIVSSNDNSIKVRLPTRIHR